MEKPIHDPPIPYIGPIYGGRFTPGKMVRIQGTVPSVAYRFEINLQCGPDTAPRSDIAVHMSVRMLDSCIVLNSLQNGIWNEEQRGMTLPIKRAERFEIIIMCNFGQYKIAINGQHYCDFPQRIHYDRISHLAIDGDVSVIEISYESSSDGYGALTGRSAGPDASSSKPSRFPVQSDDFEIVDTNAPSRANARPGVSAPPPVGFSQPPPYNAVIPGNHGAFTSSSGPPPFNASPYPSASPAKGPPYPTGGVPNMAPYSPCVPPPGTYPCPPPGMPGVPPPPPGAPIPLNAAGSNFRPVKRNKIKQYCTGLGAVMLAAIIIVIVVLTKAHRSTRRYDSDNYDHNYNSYDHDHNNRNDWH